MSSLKNIFIFLVCAFFARFNRQMFRFSHDLFENDCVECDGRLRCSSNQAIKRGVAGDLSLVIRQTFSFKRNILIFTAEQYCASNAGSYRSQVSGVWQILRAQE